MACKVQLLGIPQTSTKGNWQPLPNNQFLLLSAYLLYKEDWVSRDDLLYLFWPEEPEKTARHNLSQLLYHSKKQDWLQQLETERTRVRLILATDLSEFREALGKGNWQHAHTLYRGDFLEGLTVPSSAPFENWLTDTRVSLRMSWREAAYTYSRRLIAAEQPEDAANVLTTLLQTDPLAEDALQLYLYCASNLGKRQEGLQRYKAFKTLLKEELQIEPLEETIRLANTLSDLDKRQIQAASNLKEKSLVPKLRQFPKPSTMFIGREAELLELRKFFGTGTRLISLLGSGGTGKTRLALQLGLELAPSYKDGAAFIDLSSLGSASAIATSLLKSLGLAASNQPALEQASEYLQDKQMLLVFDNFEHVLEGSHLLVDILTVTDVVDILVTSREALHLQGEQLVDVSGLSYPQLEANNLDAYDAVRLFVTAVRRKDAHFALGQAQQDAVLRICRAVQGLPLGLELAAAWVRLLSLDDIADELEKGLSFLESPYRDLPARHQSLGTVFEQSWRLLEKEEQTTLKKLSAFRGGFRYEAAKQVADVSLTTLLSLKNKSLLDRHEKGRFLRPILVQEFAASKLTEIEHKEIYKRHADYYMTLAEIAKEKLGGLEQKDWLDLLEDELDNIRAALDWALAQENQALGLNLASSLYLFWQSRGYFKEAYQYLKALLDLPSSSKNVGSENEIVFARGLTVAGALSLAQSEYEEAKTLLDDALVRWRNYDDKQGLADALSFLGMWAREQNSSTSAQAFFEEALELYKELNDKLGQATALNEIGVLEAQFGDRAVAEKIFRETLPLYEALGNTRGLSYATGNVAIVTDLQGRTQEAVPLYQKSLELKREIGDRIGVTNSLANLAMVIMQDDPEAARKKLQESMQIVHELGAKTQLLRQISMMASVDLAAHCFERSVIQKAAVKAHLDRFPLSPPTLRQIERDLEVSKEKLDPDVFEKAFTYGKELSLQEAFRFSIQEPAPLELGRLFKKRASL